tara:strand:- start:3172 stop:4518 length:1347 start_codon:yes stop_codon:yes gene_type:complete
MSTQKSILVCPSSTFYGCHVTKMSGNKRKIRYYEKFKQRNELFNGNDEEKFNNKLEELKNKSNKISDIFELQIDEINNSHIQNFRFVQRSIEYEEQNLPIEPYIFGLWLGDGSSGTFSLTTIDKIIKDTWCNYGIVNEMNIRVDERCKRKTTVLEGELDSNLTFYMNTDRGKPNKFLDILRDLSVYRNKHIPEIYLKNSFEKRKQLLAGIIDTDGTVSSNQYSITQKSKQLSFDIKILAESLGFYSTIVETKKKCTNSPNPEHQGLYYRVDFNVNQFTSILPVKLDRKKIDKNSVKKSNCPRFDKNGIPELKRIKHEWTTDLKQKLFNVVETFKLLEPGQCVPWKNIPKLDDELFMFTSNSLRAQYKKMNESETDFTTNFVVLDIDPVLFIDDNWLDIYENVYDYANTYNSLPSKISEGIWFRNQLTYSDTMFIIKKTKLEEIKKLLS